MIDFQMDIPILYEDDDMAAVYKPAGLVVHADGRSDEPSLSDWIAERYPQAIDVGEPIHLSDGRKISRPGIVHRLDRDTSGVMLVAKTAVGFESLKKQFQGREVGKEYRAFVYGEMKQDNGTIDRPIGRSKKDFRMWSAQRGARGEMRDAVTEYEVKERGKGYTFVAAFPKTGRTHQIRVHFKAINYPLVGDALYAPDRENSLGFERLALHSYRISFADVKGAVHTVTAEYPNDFIKALLLLSA